MGCLKSVALAGALAIAMTSLAQAADMMALPPLENGPEMVEQPVELGTGWYLRGDAGWTRFQAPLLSSDLSLSSSPGTRNGWSADLGFGYKFNNWLRSDVTLEYLDPENANAVGAPVFCPYNLEGLSTQGTTPVELGYYANPNDTCKPVQTAHLTRGDMLLNGYVDLGTWKGVTPYVGAGAGVSVTHGSGTVQYYETQNGSVYAANLTPTGTYPPLWVDINGNPLSPQPTISFTQQNWEKLLTSTQYHFAWALMGGIAIDITDHLKLDLGYRYVDLGTLTGVSSNLTGQIIKQKQTSQDIRIGFRYMVD